MIDLFSQQHLVRIAPRNELEIFPELICKLFQVVVITQARHRVENKKAVVQKMRVDLGLKLLQFGLMCQ
ncbi:hypothetical protein D3C77_487720 [compost metagenome]